MPNLAFTIDKYSAGDVQQIHTNISSAKTYFNNKLILCRQMHIVGVWVWSGLHNIKSILHVSCSDVQYILDTWHTWHVLWMEDNSVFGQI